MVLFLGSSRYLTPPTPAGDAMLDALYLLVSVDQYTMVCVVGAAAVAFWLIQLLLDSTALACICAPVLLISAFEANYLFKTHFVIAAQDKDSNIVVASALGVLSAMMLILVGIWLGTMMSEKRSQTRKPMPLPELPAVGE